MFLEGKNAYKQSFWNKNKKRISCNTYRYAFDYIAQKNLFCCYASLSLNITQ